MCVWGDVRTWVASCTHSCFWGSYVPGKLGLISKGGGKGAMQSSRIWNHSAKDPSGPCSSSLSSLPPGLGLWVPEGPEEYTASGGSCVPASLRGRGTSGQGRSCHMQLTAAGAPSTWFPFRSWPSPGLGSPHHQNSKWPAGSWEGSRAGQGGANSTCSLLTLPSSFKVTGWCLPFFVAFLQIGEFRLQPYWLLGTQKGTWERKQLSAARHHWGPTAGRARHPLAGPQGRAEGLASASSILTSTPPSQGPASPTFIPPLPLHRAEVSPQTSTERFFLAL